MCFNIDAQSYLSCLNIILHSSPASFQLALRNVLKLWEVLILLAVTLLIISLSKIASLDGLC